MEIVCPGCGKVYQVSEERLLGPVRKARCKACGSVFSVQRDLSENQGREEQDASFAFHESGSPEEHTPEPPGPHTPEEAGDTEGHAIPADADGSGSDDQLESAEPAGKQGGRDYVAIAVLLAAIAALCIVSFLAIRNIDRESVFRPLRSISRLTDFFEGRRTRPAKKIHIKKRNQRSAYQGHMSRGHRYFRSKKYNAAFKEYNLAIRADSGRYEAYYWRGQLSGLRKEYPKSVKDMRQVLRLNPSYMKAHRSLGWAYFEMGKYDEAIKALDRYIKSNAKDGWAYYERALAYFKKGDLQNALRDAKNACDLGFKRGCDVYKRYQ